MAKLPIDQVILDDNLYPRQQPDWLTVYRYTQAMQQGAVFPPIVVARHEKFLVCLDGRHRVLAAKKLDKGYIEGIIARVQPEQFFFEAVRLNTAHGRPLSTQERLGAAVRLRDAGVPMAKIADVIFMPIDKIERLIIERVERIQVNGLESVIRKAPIKHGHLETAAEQRSFAARSQLQIFNQAVAILEHGFLDVNNADLLAVVARLRDLLNQAPALAARAS